MTRVLDLSYVKSKLTLLPGVDLKFELVVLKSAQAQASKCWLMFCGFEYNCHQVAILHACSSSLTHGALRQCF